MSLSDIWLMTSKKTFLIDWSFLESIGSHTASKFTGSCTARPPSCVCISQLALFMSVVIG